MTADVGHNGGPPISEDEHRERVGNWFAVSRDIFDHPIVGIHDRSFTDTEAWLYLLAIASYTPTEVQNKGAMIVLDPGQIMAAYAYLAKRWKWGPDKVRWYLKRLETEAMITRFTSGKSADYNTKQNTNHHANQSTKRNTNQIQIITICNYAIYQYMQQQLHQAKPQAEHQAKPQESNTREDSDSNLRVRIKDSMRASAEASAPIQDPTCVEYPAEHGVLVNGKTIRHESGAFTISLPAIHVAAKPSKWSEDEINARCLTRALDWGKKLASGMDVNLVIPGDIVVSLGGEIVQEAETARAEAKAERAAKKGTSLAPEWVLPKSWGEWAHKRYDVTPDRIRREAERFKNYWLAATKNATKKDWLAAWRHWCSSDHLGWRERPGYKAEAHELPADRLPVFDTDEAAEMEAVRLAYKFGTGA